MEYVQEKLEISSIGLDWMLLYKDFDYIGQGFHQVWYQATVKAAVFGVFEDLKFKISDGLDQN